LLAVKVLNRLGSVSPASLSHALRRSVALRHCAALQRIFALGITAGFYLLRYFLFYFIFILCAYNPQNVWPVVASKNNAFIRHFFLATEAKTVLNHSG